jgi:hypothetical protein
VWERYHVLLESSDGRAKAGAFKARVKSVIDQLNAVFPGRYTKTKETLRLHLEQMR